jgi:hypothetical protein
MENRDPVLSSIVRNLNPYKRAQGTHQVEHFFRTVAGLDVDKANIKRYYDFVDHKVSDLLLVGQDTATANGPESLELWDLPITKGPQEHSRFWGA